MAEPPSQPSQSNDPQHDIVSAGVAGVRNEQRKVSDMKTDASHEGGPNKQIVDDDFGQGELVNKISAIVQENLPANVPSKSRYVTRKVLYSNKDNLQALIDDPELLGRMIKQAIDDSKRKNPGRRKRGRRGGKRHHRQDKKGH